MALIVKDRVKETTTTAGLGTITLAGAASGFQSFSVIGDGNTTYYTIQDSTNGTWEVGIGTYTASGTTLTRDTVLESSSGGAKVDFAAGSKDVFVTYPAERAVYVDGSNIVPASSASLPVTNGGTGATTLTGVVKGNGTAAFTASNVNLASEVTGTLPVANGGTGASSLTANNVILGNGTSAVLFVAPGANGNVLTSNGTTWTSATPAATGATKGQAIAFSLIFGL